LDGTSMTDLARDIGEKGLWRGAASARTDSLVSVTPATEAASSRVASVDTLRGFAMFWIIAGDAFAWALHDMAAGKDGLSSAVVQYVSDQFKHVTWEGIHFYDFLFPLFLFVVGISIVFSLSNLVERELAAYLYRRKIFIRV
jgi:predicted acyltransferase